MKLIGSQQFARGEERLVECEPGRGIGMTGLGRPPDRSHGEQLTGKDRRRIEKIGAVSRQQHLTMLTGVPDRVQEDARGRRVECDLGLLVADRKSVV